MKLKYNIIQKYVNILETRGDIFEFSTVMHSAKCLISASVIGKPPFATAATNSIHDPNQYFRTLHTQH